MNKITLSLAAVLLASAARAAEIAPQRVDPVMLARAFRIAGPDLLAPQRLASLDALSSLNFAEGENLAALEPMAAAMNAKNVEVLRENLASAQPDRRVVAGLLALTASTADLAAERKMHSLAAGYLSGGPLAEADNVTAELLRSPHLAAGKKAMLRRVQAEFHAERLAQSLAERKTADDVLERFTLSSEEREAERAWERLKKASPANPARHDDVGAVARYYRWELGNDGRKALTRLEGRSMEWPSLATLRKIWTDEFAGLHKLGKGAAKLLTYTTLGLGALALATPILGMFDLAGWKTAVGAGFGAVAGFFLLGLTGWGLKDLEESSFQLKKLEEESKKN
jgi:hypothetical protein